MRRLLLPTVLLVLVLLLGGGGYAVLAFADSRAGEELRPGTRVAGIDVGGKTRLAALIELRRRVGEPARRPATLQVLDKRFTLDADKAGLQVDLEGAVDRAYAAGREGNLIERGWRSLTGAEADISESAPVTVNRARIRSFVGAVHSTVARQPKDASMTLELTEVKVTPGVTGRRLTGREDLVQRLAKALVTPGTDRALRGRVAEVQPKLTTAKLYDAQPVAVTVSRAGKMVRVFKRGELTKTYTVAVGDPKYETPLGQFTVQGMQKNPTWNVPNSEWAGKLAGQVIPGGDPRNPLVARWIGFNGSVGFHGTKSIDSLGTAASHGCVRMDPKDVSDLYERVQVGTPVLVA